MDSLSAGIADHAAAHGSSALPLFHLVLRRDPDEIDVREGPLGGIIGVFGRTAGSPVLRDHLRFYADTQELAAQYDALSGQVPVQVVPIPHCLPEHMFTGDALPALPDRPLAIVYLGNARREKGFQLLPDLVDQLADAYLATGRARFILQSNVNFGAGEPGIAAAVRHLETYDPAHVTLVDEQMSVADFQALVLAADIILLPYDPELYASRSSGILMQALAAGCPVIVPAGCWLAHQPDAAAAVIYADPAGLAEATRQAVASWPALKQAAEASAARWSGTAVSDHFIALLLGINARADAARK
jgi:glycosyltransferase involved in cell wall biosynthesis